MAPICDFRPVTPVTSVTYVFNSIWFILNNV